MWRFGAWLRVHEPRLRCRSRLDENIPTARWQQGFSAFRPFDQDDLVAITQFAPAQLPDFFFVFQAVQIEVGHGDAARRFVAEEQVECRGWHGCGNACAARDCAGEDRLPCAKIAVQCDDNGSADLFADPLTPGLELRLGQLDPAG